MAKLTKEELIQLSNDTFINNATGEITPSSHRNFNNKLIEAMPDGAGDGEWVELPYHSSTEPLDVRFHYRDMGAFIIANVYAYNRNSNAKGHFTFTCVGDIPGFNADYGTGVSVDLSIGAWMACNIGSGGGRTSVTLYSFDTSTLFGDESCVMRVIIPKP